MASRGLIFDHANYIGGHTAAAIDRKAKVTRVQRALEVHTLQRPIGIHLFGKFNEQATCLCDYLSFRDHQVGTKIF